MQGKRIAGVFERGLNEMKGGRSVMGAISNENEMGEQKEGLLNKRKGQADQLSDPCSAA